MHSVVGLVFEDDDGVWKVHSVSEDDDLEYAVKLAFYWNVDENEVEPSLSECEYSALSEVEEWCYTLLSEHTYLS